VGCKRIDERGGCTDDCLLFKGFGREEGDNGLVASFSERIGVASKSTDKNHCLHLVIILSGVGNIILDSNASMVVSNEDIAGSLGPGEDLGEVLGVGVGIILVEGTRRQTVSIHVVSYRRTVRIPKLILIEPTLRTTEKTVNENDGALLEGFKCCDVDLSVVGCRKVLSGFDDGESVVFFVLLLLGLC